MKMLTMKLNSGYEMPVIGLGTSGSKSHDDTRRAVYHALKTGYRHIDSAYVYGNEADVGDGMRAAIEDGVVTRDDIFITSKLWNTFHHKDDVRPALEKSLQNMGVDYIDLYLMHCPFAFKRSRSETHPKDDQGKIQFSDLGFTETWSTMEECVRQGLVRSVGLSNFNVNQIQSILDICTIKPAVLQCEAHPYLQQSSLTSFCADNGIVYTAYCPLGSPGRVSSQLDSPNIFTEPLLVEIAKRYNKTVAQIVIRWLILIGVVPIPKSVKYHRIEENFNVFDVTLSQDDINSIAKLDRGWRAVTFSQYAGHVLHPFPDDVPKL